MVQSESSEGDDSWKYWVIGAACVGVVVGGIMALTRKGPQVAQDQEGPAGGDTTQGKSFVGEDLTGEDVPESQTV